MNFGRTVAATAASLVALSAATAVSADTPSNTPFAITVQNLELRLPVHDKLP